MEFEYFIELPGSGEGAVNHYLFNATDDLIIQATKDEFCIRSEPLLRVYFKALLNGSALPGFSHQGSLTVDDEHIRPMIDVLSYKAHVEEKLHRVNRAIGAHGKRILDHIQAQGPPTS